MRVTSPKWALGVVAALTVAGCTFNPAIPEDARITCEADSECRDQRICHNGYCVRPDAVDGTPPDLVSAPTVTPNPGGKGAHFVIAFDSTEALLGLPEVDLLLDTPTVVPCEVKDEVHFSCAYDATATGEENGKLGGPAPFDIHLVDRGGNETVRRRAGTLDFDFLPPTLAAQSLEPDVAKRDAEIQLFLTVNEPLKDGKATITSSVPLVVDGGGTQTAFEVPIESGTLNLHFVHTVVAGDPQGDVTFTATLTDEVGNQATVSVDKKVTIDAVPPVLGPTVTIEGSPAKKDAQIAVSFSIAKPLAEPPRVTVGGIDMKPDGTVAPPNYRYTHTADPAIDTEGTQGVVVQAEDAAGNYLIESIGTVTFDFTKPTLILKSPSPAHAKQGDTILYTVSADEPLAGAPKLSVGGDANFFPTNSGTYVFSHPVTLADPQGTSAVTITATDLAGNTTTDTGDPIDIDSVSPTLSNLTVSPQRTNQTGVVTATFDVSEALPATGLSVRLLQSTLPDGGVPSATSLAFNCSGYDAGSPNYLCTRPTTGDETAPGTETTRSVVVQASDSAGNPAIATGTVVYDFQAPSVFGAANPALAKLNDTLLYTVTSVEALSGSPAVRVFRDGGEVQGFFAALGSQSNTSFVFKHPVTPGDDGTYDVQIDVADVSGNDAGYALPAAFAIDATRPVVAASSVTPALAKAGALVTATLEASEALDVPPLVTLDGTPMDLDGGSLPDGGWQYVATQTVTFVDGGDGPHPVQAMLQDPAGNTTFATLGVVTYDFIPPGIVGQPIVARKDAWLYANFDGGVFLNTFADAQISFAANEALKTAPTVTISSSNAQPLSQQGLSYTFSYHASGSEPQANPATSPPTPIQLTMTDLAGNTGTVTLGGIYFDFVAPAPFDTTKVVYTRDATHSAYWIQATPGAFEPFAVTQIINQTTTIDHQAFGDGSLPLSTATGDAQTIYVAQRDRAGNATNASDVKRVIWRANFVNKLAGDTQNNVNAAFYEDGSLTSPGFGTTTELSTPEYLQLAAQSGFWNNSNHPPIWQSLSPATAPSPRWGHAMAFDSTRNRVVLFGGNDGTGVLGDTWEWDGITWTQKFPATSPPARESAKMVYDGPHGVAVLFGGDNGASLFGDTWVWNGTNWVNKNVSGPPARREHAMAYGGNVARTVVFGGYGNLNVRLNDTWEWNGTVWQQQTPTQSPPGRVDAVMAWDPNGQKMLLFGGSATGGTYGDLGDLWSWNGNNWTLISSGGPQARSDSAITWDGLRSRIMLYGGFGQSLSQSSQPTLSDSWQFASVPSPAWSALSTFPAPPGRGRSALVYDSNAMDPILFGGISSLGASSTLYGDTWRYGPPAKRALRIELPVTAKITDPHTFLSFSMSATAGGQSTSGLGVVAELYDGTSWVSVATNSAGPSVPAAFTGSVTDPTHLSGMVSYPKFGMPDRIVARIVPIGTAPTPINTTLTVGDVTVDLLYQRQ